MKKIAILAVKTHNYGSLLQTYALQKVIDNLGYENEIIEYKKTNMLKQASRLFNIPLLKQTLAKVLKKVYVNINSKQLKQLFYERTRAFNEFTKKLRFSSPYVGRKNLISGCENYSCFVLGSDQVWNPMNYGADFFSMSFVPDNIKKIAYAPSFGVTSIPKHQKKGTIKYLERINYLSVREKSGKELIFDLIGKEAKIVVDPTILLERKYWDEIRGERIVVEPYIMCYFLGNNEEHRNFAERLQEKTGLKIVTLPHMDEIVPADFGFGNLVPNAIGPAEFVNLISNAEYVCTDSFHGTVFSILYKRKFFTFNRYKSSKGESTNSRLNSILELCKLDKRKFDSTSDITQEMLDSIDYSAVDSILSEMRRDSLHFLKEAIEE